MQITVNGKEYKVEFTFEAAESDTVQKVFEFFSGAYMFKGIKSNKPDSEMTEDEKMQASISQVDAMISGISEVPRLAIDLFHTGLLEYHGDEIKSRDDAKQLYKQFCRENPDSEMATQYGLFEALKAQMETDGFFKRIGLVAMMEKSDQNPQNQPKKRK